MNAKAMKEAMSNATEEEKEKILQKIHDMGLSQPPYDKESFLADLEPPMRARFEVMHDIQDQLDALQKQHAKERKELELKYRALFDPLYIRRSRIVTGDETPAGAEGGEPGIKNFWLTCLANNDEIGDFITEKDSKVLEHLLDITCTHFEGEDAVDSANGDNAPKYGFMLTFKFSPNEYFNHAELTKTYLFQDEEMTILMKSVGTDIEWHQGKDPTIKIMKKKGKGGAAAKFKTEHVESFFNFFKPPAIPEEEDPDMEAEDEEELQEAIEDDYEMGCAIKDKILPTALKWYTGEADQGGITLGDDDDDDEDDDDDDDDEEGEDNEDEDGAPVAPPTDKKEADCKQQ